MDDGILGERGFLKVLKDETGGTLAGGRRDRPVEEEFPPRRAATTTARQRGTEKAPSTADRRFSVLLVALERTGQVAHALTLRVVKTAAGRGGTLRIGNVSAPLMVPERPELVPTKFGLLNGEAVGTARHLRWILQYLLR